MRGLEHFSLKIKDLKNGEQRFIYSVDDSFFVLFDDAAISSGKLDIELLLLRNGRLIDAIFDINGYFKTTCDRCTADIQMPIDATFEAILKIVDEATDDDLDTYFIHSADLEYNLAPLVYEAIVINMPMINTLVGCESLTPKPCDNKTLEAMEYEEDESADNKGTWDILKDLKLDKN